MSQDSNRALWRHVYFIERLLKCIALKLFENPDELKRCFQAVSRDGDEHLIDDMMK